MWYFCLFIFPKKGSFIFLTWIFLSSKNFSGFQQFDALGQTKWHHFKGHILVFSANRKAYAASILDQISHWLVVMDERKACVNIELEDTINMFYRRKKPLFYTIP